MTRTLLLLVALLLAAWVLGTPTASAHTSLRVMPLGDSITTGFGPASPPGTTAECPTWPPCSESGYRLQLSHRLVEAGVGFRFVGSRSTGPHWFHDREHEGHEGWGTTEVLPKIAGWVRDAEPDVVLLLLGTNDCTTISNDCAGAPARMVEIIVQIHVVQPHARILVMTLPPSAPPAGSAEANVRVTNFNTTLANRVAGLAADNYPVRLVDTRGILTTADLADGVHLTSEGYVTMANLWFEALAAWGF